jgi:hypothetical protein
MYHVELRQFPHNFCRFNLTEQELRDTVLLAWARGAWVDLGERKWNPEQATLTVLEGPQIPVAQLSMGRGWRSATSKGRNVTAALLAGARAEGAAAQAPASLGQSAGPAPTDADSSTLELAADSLGLEALSRLSQEPQPVALVWKLARERYPDRSAGDCLRLAELAVGSLARTGLVSLLRSGKGELDSISSTEGIAMALQDIGSWGAGPPGSLSMRKA